LVGESGCGKTTLGQAILGLLPESAQVGGSIRFEGGELLGMPEDERRALLGSRISTVPQAAMAVLDPMYTVGDQLAEVFTTHRRVSSNEAHELSVNLLSEVALPAPEARMSSYPHELSGGSRQRVVIASGIALNPALVIADEPTSALDVTIQAQVIRLLRRLITEHTGAVLLISHDLGVVAQLCNRVAVMYAGQIVEQANVEELFAEPCHPYTRGLLAAHPALATPGQRLMTIDGEVPDPDALPAGCSFRPRCPIAIADCTADPPWVEAQEGHRVRCVHFK
jgi:oligopeptide/dipeptide ABC transporter ATP-binding protein